MSKQPLVGYRGYTPEEFQAIMRRAHAERAKALRELFVALFAWRKSAPERRHDANAALKTAGCH